MLTMSSSSLQDLIDLGRSALFTMGFMKGEKVMGPVVDTEFKFKSQSNKDESQKGENEMTDKETMNQILEELKQMRAENEELKKTVAYLNANKEATEPKQETENSEEMVITENVEPKKKNFIAKGMDEHPVVTTLGIAAVGAIGVIAAERAYDAWFSNDDDDEDDAQEGAIVNFE